MLFEVRAKNPRKGFIAVPGGFVDFEESLEEVIRTTIKEQEVENAFHGETHFQRAERRFT